MKKVLIFGEGDRVTRLKEALADKSVSAVVATDFANLLRTLQSGEDFQVVVVCDSEPEEVFDKAAATLAISWNWLRAVYAGKSPISGLLVVSDNRETLIDMRLTSLAYNSSWSNAEDTIVSMLQQPVSAILRGWM